MVGNNHKDAMVGYTLVFSCRLEERLKCFLYNVLLQGVRSSELVTPGWLTFLMQMHCHWHPVFEYEPLAFMQGADS